MSLTKDEWRESQTMRFLLEAAHKYAILAPAASRSMITRMRAVAHSAKFAVHKSVAQRFCRRCSQVYVPGTNCAVTLEPVPRKRRRRFPRVGPSKYVVYTCSVCGARRKEMSRKARDFKTLAADEAQKAQEFLKRARARKSKQKDSGERRPNAGVGAKVLARDDDIRKLPAEGGAEAVARDAKIRTLSSEGGAKGRICVDLVGTSGEGPSEGRAKDVRTGAETPGPPPSGLRVLCESKGRKRARTTTSAPEQTEEGVQPSKSKRTKFEREAGVRLNGPSISTGSSINF